MSTAVEIETGSRISTWRTFGRIQWHVISAPRVTLQGERNLSAILKIVLRRILFFLFFMQFGASASGGFRIVFSTFVCQVTFEILLCFIEIINERTGHWST